MHLCWIQVIFSFKKISYWPKTVLLLFTRAQTAHTCRRNVTEVQLISISIFQDISSIEIWLSNEKQCCWVNLPHIRCMLCHVKGNTWTINVQFYITIYKTNKQTNKKQSNSKSYFATYYFYKMCRKRF